jgi:hypothetical protein
MKNQFITAFLISILFASIAAVFVENTLGQSGPVINSVSATPTSSPTNPQKGNDTNNWSDEVLVETNNISCDLPASVAYNNKLYLVWQSNQDGNDQLYLKTFDGLQWSETSKLTDDTASYGGARLVVYKGLLYLFFHATIDDPQRDIYYITFDGQGWSAPVSAVQHQGVDDFCGLAVYNNRLYLAWTTDRTGNFDLYYKSFDGVIWSSESQLTSDPAPDLHPALMAFDGKLFVQWHSLGYNASSWDIFYETFDETIWSNPIQLTSNPSIDEGPGSFEAVGDSLYLSFSSSRDGNKEIYYDVLREGQWSGEKRLTFSNETEWHSSLTFFDGKLYAFFESDRVGSRQIYYKMLNITPVESIGIEAFSVQSNSTITALAFNSTSQQFSFSVSGPAHTTGYVSVNVSKAVLADVSRLTVNLDGVEMNFTATEGESSWLIYLTYSHSSHVITFELNQKEPEEPFTPTMVAFAICVTIAVFAIAFLLVILIYRNMKQIHLE